jgi:hypothetical protein
VTAQINLQLNERNDETVNLVLLQPDGVTPYNLTGAVVNFWIKPSAMSQDTDIDVIQLSTSTSGVVVTNATGGLATVNIPLVDLHTPTGRFYRVDVIAGGQTKTAIYGQLQVTNL